MILLTLTDIRKHFGPEPVLNGVSFDMRTGERTSLVGPNGAGKTTLMRIISGDEESDGGRLERHPSVRIGYLEQHPEFTPGRNVWEEARTALDHLLGLVKESEQLSHDIAAATDPIILKRLGTRFDELQHYLHQHEAYAVERKMEQVLGGLGFTAATFEQQVATLSGGQQNRLLLAKLLLAEPDVMLLDEPSNHLDIDATQWLEDYLVNSNQTLLVVSHDRYFHDKVTNRTLELYRGTVESYPGNFTQYKRLKAERLEVQVKTYEKQQEEIAKLEDFVRRYAYGDRHTQAEDRRKKLERIERIEVPRQISSPLMSFPAATRTGDIVLRATGLTKAFDRPLFKDLTFDLLRGEKWGVLGPNGCGKTTLLKCLLGIEPLNSGRVTLGSGVKVGYFDQMLTGIDPEKEAVEAVRPDHKEFNTQERRDLLARFGITGDMVFQKVGSFSGGERNRTALAYLSALDANVLILDEPTNHLDLWARGALEAALKEFDGTVLFVSHDRYFLNQVATKLLVVEPGRFRVIDGNYETYLHFLKEGLAADSRTGGNIAAAASAKSGDAKSGDTRPEKDRRKRKFPYKKAAEVEAEIHRHEGRIEELHALMGEEAVLRDGPRVKQLMEEVQSLQASLPQLYEHWEEAIEMNG